MISTLVLVHKAYGPDAIKSSASSVQPSNALVCARKKRRKGGHASLVTRHLFPSSISRQGEIDNQESGSAHFPVMYPVTKVSLISDIFSLRLKSPKKVLNHDPDR